MSLRNSYKKPQADGGGGDFKKPFALTEGKNLVRPIFLPELAPEGKWFKYVAQHFGYKVLNRDGEEKLRTFVCPRVYNSKTKEERHPCAECSKIERQEALLKKREVQYESEGLTPDDIATRTQSLRDWLSSHNRDVKYFVHVMNDKGEFGYVKLPSTAFYEMKEHVQKLDKEQGIDAFSPDQGIWFSVNKTGKGFSTKYSTTIEMEVQVINGKRMMSEKLAPLTDEQLEQALRECPQFDKLLNVISDRQIEQLAISNGTPEEVTAILGAPNRRENSASPVPRAVQAARTAEAEAEQAEEPVVVAPRPAAPLTTGSHRGEPLAQYGDRVRAGIGTNAAPAPAVDAAQAAEEAELEAKLAALKARKTNGTVTQAAPRQPVPDFRDPATPAESFIDAFGEE
jgi:hypothetical protein